MGDHKHNYPDNTVEKGNEACKYFGVSRSRQEGEEKQDMRDDKCIRNTYLRHTGMSPHLSLFDADPCPP
jgi:hypothetical protein